MTVMLMLMMSMAEDHCNGRHLQILLCHFATGRFDAVFDGTDADDWLCKCKQHVIMDDKHSIYDKDIIDDMYGCPLWINLRHFAEGRHPGDQMMSKIL